MEPYYDTAQWESDHARSDKIMKQLMEFDYLESVPVAKPKRLTELLPEISPSRPNAQSQKAKWQAGAGVAVADNDEGLVEKVPKKNLSGFAMAPHRWCSSALRNRKSKRLPSICFPTKVFP